MNSDDDPAVLSSAHRRKSIAVYITLILAWHWVVLSATLALIDWWLGYGAPAASVPTTLPFDRVSRAVGFFVSLWVIWSLLTMVLVEGLIAWAGFRLVTRRRPPNPSLFFWLWWRLCLWVTQVLPTASLAFAVSSQNYDAAMNVPLLWSLYFMIGPAVAARLRTSEWLPPGFCRNCGYDLTGNVSGRCPECATPVGRS